MKGCLCGEMIIFIMLFFLFKTKKKKQEMKHSADVHRIIESLQLENSSKINKSNCQPITTMKYCL